MQFADGSKHLLDYLSVVVRRRWIIYVAACVSVLVALVASFTAQPLYRATATLQIERQNPDILTFRDLAKVDHSWTAYADFYQTQFKILASRPVAALAAARLGVAQRAEFNTSGGGPGWLARLRSLLPRRGSTSPLSPEEIAASRVAARLEIAPIRGSQLVRVSWVGPDAALAAEVANAVAEAYIQATIQSNYQATDQAREFLVTQIATLRREIAGIEDRLQSYGESKRIVSIDETNNITLKALQDIAERLTAAQTVLAQAQAAHRSAETSPAEALPEILTSELIARLRQEYAGYEIEHSEKSRLFQDDWPGLVTLRSKLEQARERLDLETERIARQVRAGAQANYDKARGEVDNLERLLARHEQEAQGLKRDAVEYANLATDLRSKRQTLDVLMTRQNEMALSTHLKDLDSISTNIRFMERARPPVAPFRPNTSLNLVIGLMIGLSAGVTLAFFLDYLDNSVNSVEELRQLVELPVLAVIPRHAAQAATRLGVRSAPNLAVADNVDLLALRDPQASACEAYRELRTSLLLFNPGHPPQRIMLTSPLPEEGKTACTVNLAIVLAQLGRRVALVDTDLRRPRLNKVFGVSNARGVSTFLSGLESDPLQLIVPTDLDKLDLLPSGPIPPNPSELLNSPIFAQLGTELLARGYDHVLFDSPPVLVVSDPMIIASVVDVKLLVVRAGRTPRNAVRQAADKLRQVGQGPLGAVLNFVELTGQIGSRYHYAYENPEDAAAPLAPSGRRASSGRSA